jgi:hypothetical protein
LNVHVVLRVDFWHDSVAHVRPRFLVEEISNNFHIKRDAAMFHLRRYCGEFAPMQRGAKIKLRFRHQSREQFEERIDVRHYVLQNFRLLLRRVRPAAHDELADFFFVNHLNGGNAIVGECAK